MRQSQERVLVLTRERCSWLLVGRGQGCHRVSLAPSTNMHTHSSIQPNSRHCQGWEPLPQVDTKHRALTCSSKIPSGHALAGYHQRRFCLLSPAAQYCSQIGTCLCPRMQTGRNSNQILIVAASRKGRGSCDRDGGKDSGDPIALFHKEKGREGGRDRESGR